MTDGKLIDGEVTGVVFPSLLRIYWYPRLAQRIIGATSPASMAAQRWCAVAHSSSPAMACPGERGYNISRS